MMEPEDVERFRRHIRTYTTKANDAEGLAQLLSLHAELDRAVGEQARTLNESGIPWRQLAAAAGIPRMTFHDRYAR